MWNRAPASLSFSPCSRLVLALALGALSCAPALELDPTASLRCEADSQCPAAWHCATAIRRCVRDDDPDHAGPALQRATAESPTVLVLDFSEPLFAEGLEQLAHYSLLATGEGEASGLEVTAAFLRGEQTLVLTTSTQRAGQGYLVAVEGLFDLAGNQMAAAEVDFAGFGERPDATPPELLSPPPDTALVGPDVLFVWAPRRGAVSYTLEVWLDEEMASPLVQQEVAAPQTSAALQLSAGSYFWRVRSDVSVDGEPAPLHLFSNTVHVHCAAGADCAEESGAAGTVQRPFRRISRGMELAVRLGLSRVAIAGRGEGAAYAEGVVVSEGLALLGGYDARFAVRDPVAHPTTVLTETSPALMVPYVNLGSTLLSGLRIVVESDAERTRALHISNSSSNLVVEDCEVAVVSFPSSSNSECVAVVLQDSGNAAVRGPTLRNNAFSASCGARSVVALSLRSASPVVEGNTLASVTGDPIGQVFGILSEGISRPMLERNTLQIESYESATGISLSTPRSGNEIPQKVLISGNRAIVKGSPAVGIDLPDATDVGVEANRLVVQGNSTLAIWARNVRGVTVINNVLVAGTGEWENQRHVGIEANEAAYSVHGGMGLQIASNTVVLGRVGDAENGGAIGISLSSAAQPSIIDNLIVALPSTGRRYGVYEEGDESDPSSLHNNAFAGLDVLYRDDVLGELTADTALDGLDGQVLGTCTSCPMNPQGRVGGNVALALTPAELFADFAGPDGSSEVLLDADLHLAAGAPAELLSGGLDASGSGYCLPQGSTVGQCASVTTDFDGTPRTVGWSIGAFERD